MLVGMKDAKILRDQLFIIQNVASAAVEDTTPGVENDHPIRNIERQPKVLFD
jgi:hypothetical protein